MRMAPTIAQTTAIIMVLRLDPLPGGGVGVGVGAAAGEEVAAAGVDGAEDEEVVLVAASAEFAELIAPAADCTNPI